MDKDKIQATKIWLIIFEDGFTFRVDAAHSIQARAQEKVEAYNGNGCYGPYYTQEIELINIP